LARGEIGGLKTAGVVLVLSLGVRSGGGFAGAGERLQGPFVTTAEFGDERGDQRGFVHGGGVASNLPEAAAASSARVPDRARLAATREAIRCTVSCEPMRLLPLFLLLLGWANLLESADPAPTLDEAQRRRLEAGECLVLDRRPDETAAD